jgi:glucokinase
MDIPRGMFLEPHNLPHWHYFPIRDCVAEAFNLPVAFANDANAASYGEFWVGSGKQYHSIVLLTLGTGVGGGIVLDGRLVLGYHGTAGEIGHQVIDCTPGAPRCGCGNTGCLESFVRAAALATAAGTVTAADAFAADERGDPRARAAVEQWIDYLAIGLANVVTMLTPERIVLGLSACCVGAAVLGGAHGDQEDAASDGHAWSLSRSAT